MKLKYYLPIMLLFFSISCSEQQVNHPKEEHIVIGKEGKKLDSLLTPYVNTLRELTHNEAGLAIGVTKGNQTIYARCFGYSNIAQEIKVDFNTNFHIASVSKPFVAFAIAKLIEQKKITVEDKIIDLLPEFIMEGVGYDQITVKHILTHHSGIPTNISPDDWTNPSFGENALDENLEIIKTHRLDFEPGTQYRYSNSAFDILGLVISRASGMSFSDYITSQVLVPAGMNNTRYKIKDDSLSDQRAMSYSYGIETQEWHPYPYNEKLFPSSGILSNLNDMLKWTQIHIGKGTYQNNTVLQEEYFELLTNPQNETPWGDQIGLSWFLQSYLEKPIIMHQGQDTGFESIVYLYPNEEVSIVVMANRDFSRTGRIMNAVSEILFDQAPKSYDVSAKYPFSDVYKKEGIENAKVVWSQLKKDTTDVYSADDDDILTTGAILENGKNWKETKEILEYYNTLNDNSTYSWRLLGNAYLHLGDTLRAISHYKKCLDINPNYEKAKIALERLED